MLKLSTRPATTPRAIKGFSLVELMVALAIGMVLLAGLVNVVTSSGRSQNELTKSSRQLDSGRYAIQVLTNAVQHAGFYGRFAAPAVPAATPNACSTNAAVLADDLGLPIEGYNAPAAPPANLACLPASGHVPGTDILIVRRVAGPVTAYAARAAGTWYLQSLPTTSVASGVVLQKATGSSADDATFNLTNMDGTRADLRQYHIDIYFISPCSTGNADGSCPAGHDGIPTLKRKEMPAGNVVALAQGIQNMQIDYGVDTLVAADQDGAPDPVGTDLYFTDPAAIGGTNITTPAGRTLWSNVMAVRFNLLARNLEQSTGHTDKKKYNLGAVGTVGAFNDRIKRRVFSSVVRVTNPSSRREMN